MATIIKINPAPPLTEREEAVLELLKSNPENSNYALYDELMKKRDRWLRAQGIVPLSGLVTGPKK